MAQTAINELLAKGTQKLLIDFAKLDYISSAGLRVLLIAAKRLKESDGRFAICSLNDNVADVFAVSGFGSFIDIHPDEASALAAMTS